MPVGDIHFWAHQPDDDASDGLTRSRWYCHVHSSGDRNPSEHNDVHLFLHQTDLAELLERREAAYSGQLESEGHAAYEAGNDVLAVCPIDLDAGIASLVLD